MGSGASKASPSRPRRDRSKGKGRVFQSSCLGTPSGSHDNDDGDQVFEHHDKDDDFGSFTNRNGTVRDEVKVECHRKAEVDSSTDMSCMSSDNEFQEWNQPSGVGPVASAGSSSIQASSTQSSNPANRFLSRFSFFPGNVSFRLSRATSVRSSRDYNLSPTNLTVEDNEEDFHLHGSPPSGLVNLNGSQQGNVESGLPERRATAREPVERNVRFSRTLSVGRLRDRVLRRSSLSELSFGAMQLGEVRNDTEGSEGQVLSVETTDSAPADISAPSASTSGYSPSGLSRTLFNNQDHDIEATRSREARYRDLLEHRTDFLERRRRIRSQVRALQRLGSRFENLSGHERSCILSGQHRTGRCTCRSSTRDATSNDDANARASISRIVMLAEALFEQSVVLSSRPSVSSIGSVPAPNEVVDSLPTRLYKKLQKNQNEEAAQCYICLVEYEDGDSMRILPCNHEFHRTCVDKWLKEIHRVCPLCRGDICRSDSFSAEDEANQLAI
ncbi:uncharacterized protein LOC104442332 isoform X2 [Eucalyptus grandis]|uniref:uncharacterized protein LOC104442332 isoform X2 n=1 Tax=Eucalyptus grandis TaxID=71139 RepID=UPI00192E9EB4|nr:uncharacterized protein LOC104442332 isoform X2 [Eucalyptus grandis]